jgi:hypothetical protein
MIANRLQPEPINWSGWNGQLGRSRRQLAAAPVVRQCLINQWPSRAFGGRAGSPTERASGPFHPEFNGMVPARWLCLLACLLLFCLSANNALAAGAVTPFTTLEAEAGILGGGAAILSMTNLPTAPTVQLESSGRKCVELDATGESVTWTNAETCNAIVIRASIPDAPGGGGLTNTLNLYVNGAFRQTFTLTSRYSWIYGVNGFTNNNPAAGTPKRFYDMQRAFISGAAVAPGSAIMLRKDATNTADYYRIDLIQLENVGPPLAKPANTLSVTNYGATADDETDDSTAFKNCITACQNQGKGMWIPAGTFRTQGIISANGINIYGAGMWHTINQRVVSTNVAGYRHKWDLTDCTIQDLYIENPEVARTAEGGHDYGMTVQGANGWTVQRVWVHRGGACFWVSGTDGIINDCRATESWADGINLNNGPSVVAEKRGFNLTCTNNYIIGSGDDGIAINAQNGGSTNWNMVDTKVLNNTSIAVNWANGIRVAGGRNSLIENNLVTDPTDSNGIRVGEFGVNGNSCESVLVVGNLILRGCGIRTLYGHGGITVSDDATATIVSNTIIDSPGIGIDVQACNATFTGNVISRAETNGFLIKSGVTGTGMFDSNLVTNIIAGQSAFRNDSPVTFLTTLTNNSWQSLAQGQSATASSFQAGNAITNGNDGNAATRWAASSGSMPQWWQVDLGASRNITGVGIDWYNSSSRGYGYQIAVSSNNTNFTTVVDKSTNTLFGNTTDNFPALARYVKITVTSCTSAGGSASFYECNVYGSSAPAVALNPTNITASVSGNTLTLSWPADHLGWRLQVQTNSLAAGLGTNWAALPGTDLVTSTNLNINPANRAVFYRMIYP